MSERHLSCTNLSSDYVSVEQKIFRKEQHFINSTTLFVLYLVVVCNITILILDKTFTDNDYKNRRRKNINKVLFICHLLTLVNLIYLHFLLTPHPVTIKYGFPDITSVGCSRTFGPIALTNGPAITDLAFHSFRGSATIILFLKGLGSVQYLFTFGD